MKRSEQWIGTEEAARRLGMSSEWIRRQIRAGRLPARAWLVGKRPTYRLRLSDLDDFERRFSG